MNKKRTLVIGDIHGGLKALKQVFERANVTENDHLIFLGDYVDGWSESAQVIEFLMKLQETNTCDFIYGNHDAWCHEWLQNKETNFTWLQHGGRETVKSYDEIPVEDQQKHKLFFDNMQNYLVDDQNRLFIHAGFSSMHGPEKEHYSSMLSWDRTLWEIAVAMHGRVERDEISYSQRLKLFSEVYIGHTPTQAWGIDHPWNRSNVWNVDTGAAFKGKLSVLDIDSKEFWQSDRVMDFYPTEKGRNK